MAESSDPFEALKRLDGDTAAPLPADVVRARGDRLRRRRTALRAVAAAAAVAVVTTGGVALGGNFSNTAPAPPPSTQGPQPPPSPASPTASPISEIPADFPIAANIAVTREPPPTVLADRLEFCAERPLAHVSPIDAVSAESSGGETSETRTLLLFGDGAAAGDAETALLESAAACPQEVTNVVGEIEVLPASGDWPGRTVRTTYAPRSAKLLHVVRVGAALLLTQSYLRSAPQDGLGESRASVMPLVTAMEQFRTAAAPPSDGTDLPGTSARVDIPPDFPLATGYPEDRFEEDELLGPGPDVEVFDRLEACGRTVSPRQTGVDRLGVSFTQPEDTRLRLLTTFETVEAAESALADYAGMYQGCPRQEHELGGATLTELHKIEPGDQGYVAIRTFEQQEGLPTLGLELLYLVRVGNAVLLQTTSNEGGGNERQIYAFVREQTALVSELTDAMCIFSDAGCSE